MDGTEKTRLALRLLTEKAEALGRLPRKDDFDSQTVCLIKQKLGPWPRALEQAGLKPPPVVSAKEKSRLKRERSRRNRKQSKKRILQTAKPSENDFAQQEEDV